jgi:4-diphosphocytidyl-2-C-methyl-D-erythritol kinase
VNQEVRWEAPAKINLNLELRARDGQGLHPIRSLVQAVECCDLLEISVADEDQLSISGADLPEGGDNLVWRAITELRKDTGRDGPPFAIRLSKRIPVAAGLGGGSSNAAAALMAVGAIMKVSSNVLMDLASRVGADVPFFIRGGCLWAEGYGERLTPARIDIDYVLALAVPDFELSTARVYEEWDAMGGPTGQEAEGRGLPPGLRSLEPLRNDLTPAAMHLRPELGDWIVDLTDRWERPVLMSGSGPSLFAFFADREEAEDAARAVPQTARLAIAALPRSMGVSQVVEPDEGE